MQCVGRRGVPVTWVAHLVSTVTGVRGARLDLTSDGSWSIPVNGIEDWKVTVSKDQLGRIDPDWWGPWRASVLVSWDTGAGLVPWVMGPITGPPAETRATATLACKGLGALLEHRVVLPRDYGLPGEYEGDMTALARDYVSRVGRSLGSIAQDIVDLSTDRKLGGHLPVRYGSPREHHSSLNERTYMGYNLANNGTWKRLTELSEVIGGPDIAFRPAFTDDSQTHVEWVMMHGTSAQPGIEQDWTMDLDTTSSKSPVASVDVSTDASGLTNRVYWTGAGEDEGTLVRMSQNMRMLEDGTPLLESVGSTSDSESPSLVQAHADSALDAGARPLQQLTIQVDGSDPRCEIGRWHVGDMARVTIGDEWLTVAPGTRPLKIIAAKGDWSSSMVTLEFQEVRMAL